MTILNLTNAHSMSLQTSFLTKTSPLRKKSHLGEVEEEKNKQNKSKIN